MRNYVLSLACVVPLLALAAPTPATAATPAADRAGGELDRITAPAWAAAEAGTGQVIVSERLDEPSKIASLAKMMTALVIADYAASHPEVLDETVTFSAGAVARRGTKTGLKAGERLSVREALYGLLLPSGNDAGYALARHFNARFADDPEAGAKRNGLAFVAEMNRQAQALGMTNSRFRSSFGDGGTPDDRTSTPRDLLTLARALAANPLLHKIYSTRTYEGTAHDAQGNARSVTWTNTNKLLRYPQVSGMKTGFNKSARACLVVEVKIEGKVYHIVVLGSPNDAQRYADARAIIRHIKNAR